MWEKQTQKQNTLQQRIVQPPLLRAANGAGTTLPKTAGETVQITHRQTFTLLLAQDSSKFSDVLVANIAAV